MIDEKVLETLEYLQVRNDTFNIFKVNLANLYGPKLKAMSITVSNVIDEWEVDIQTPLFAYAESLDLYVKDFSLLLNLLQTFANFPKINDIEIFPELGSAYYAEEIACQFGGITKFKEIVIRQLEIVSENYHGNLSINLKDMGFYLDQGEISAFFSNWN